MKKAMALYRLGSLGMLLGAGVFLEKSLTASLGSGAAGWSGAVILFGFGPLAGLFLLTVRRKSLEGDSLRLMVFSHGAALLSIFWLLLWCFVWLAMMVNLGDKAEMYIKHTAYLHLFGVGFSMAGYATGWMEPSRGPRSARFLMATGWAVSYMSWFNLYLQPAMRWLWAPACGGWLVVLGAFLIERRLKKRAVE